MKVLLAEDNIVNQEVAKAMLGQRGIDVHVVENGKAAVQRVLSERFDLVFMDVQMPVMDGIEATLEIRRQESLGTFGRLSSEGPVPIIALTAHVLHQDRARCFEAGMNDFLGKPLDGDALTGVLRKWAPASGVSPLEANRGCPDAEGSFASSLVIWDREAFAERMLNNIAVMEKVRAIALDFLPEQIRNLKQAISGRNSEIARDFVHDIKGMAANLGALALKGIAEKIEQCIRSGLPVEVADLKQLDFDCKAFVDCLKGWEFA